MFSNFTSNSDFCGNEADGTDEFTRYYQYFYEYSHKNGRMIVIGCKINTNELK